MWQEITVIQTADGKNQCPVVDINNDGFWRIYYSHRDKNNHSYTSYIDVEAGNPQNLIEKSQQPVLVPGPAGSVDASGAMASSIITISGNLKYMYYVGWSQRRDVPYFNTTCLAISADGEVWNKVGPILSPTIHDPGYSGTFYPILNRSKTQFTALYLSCFEWIQTEIKDSLGISIGWEPRYNLKRAVSNDGVTWNKTADIAIDIEEDEGGVSQASIYYNAMQGIYQTWYSLRGRLDFRNNSEHAYRIKYAESYDLVSWEKKKSEYDIYPSKDPNAWNNIMSCYPCVIEYDGTLFMFHNGNGFGDTGIGISKWVQ